MAVNKLESTHVRGLSQRKTLLPDLRSPGMFARWPIIGLSMFILGSLVFTIMFYNLRSQGPLLQWDRVIAVTLPAIGLKSPPIVQIIMEATFYIGDHVVLVLGFILSLYFIYKRFWQELTMAIIGWVGTAIINQVILTLVNRPRPPTQIWNILHVPGFPSGHSFTAVVFYGFITYFLFPKIPSAIWKGIEVAAGLFLIGFIGFSRIFTGGHYLTDVLAGYGIGLAWAGVVYTLIELYFQKRKKQYVKKE